jgi:hypothetical protein
MRDLYMKNGQVEMTKKLFSLSFISRQNKLEHGETKAREY